MPTRIPWYIWLSAVAVTSAMIGIHWDISWHRSIGRDSFLTPAHVAIYLCGVLAGVCCGYLILSTTFSNSPLRDVSVRVWGFRGPLGAFVAAWGGFVMLTSAPFDDWWHSAYGLDVKILSPPHVVLAIGILGVEAGLVLLIASERNRAEGRRRRMLDLLFIYAVTMGLIALMAVSMEYYGLPMQHSALFYEAVCVTVPFMLGLASAASQNRWAATEVAGINTAFMLGMLWILPRFPAEPKLGPVYHQVTQFIPPAFPLLILIPAFALDLFWAQTHAWPQWKKALLSGPLFLVAFVAAQWPFASFLQTPAARNAVFGSDYFDYLTSPASYQFRHLFYPMESTAREFWTGMAWALLWATVSVYFGLLRGTAVRKLRR